jgi:hypothetical protein
MEYEMSMFEDDDNDYGYDDYKEDFMGRTPKSSYFEIARTANQNVVENELEAVFRRLAVAEKMLEDRGLDDALEREIQNTMIDKEIDDRTATVFIDLVSSIVTKCE